MTGRNRSQHLEQRTTGVENETRDGRLTTVTFGISLNPYHSLALGGFFSITKRSPSKSLTLIVNPIGHVFGSFENGTWRVSVVETEILHSPRYTSLTSIDASPSSVRSLSMGEEKVGAGEEKETAVTIRGESLGDRGRRLSFFWMREVMKLRFEWKMGVSEG
jgi:hypothetical protein